MAKRRVKKRTHVGAKGAPPTSSNGPAKPGDRSPRSMVIRIGAGEVGPSVTQLVKDVRSMMEPGTATRLKERRTNRLRDYTTMAGPLGVSHLLLFSRSESGNTNLRLAITPRGPTLHFRVEKYSLCKDILKSMKRPRSSGGEYLTSPLLVMNNFTTPATDESKANDTQHVPKHLESLATTVFQSLFPPISPQTTSLKSIKRVLLLDRIPASSKPDSPDSSPYTIQLRHYAITTKTSKSALPRPLRRLNAATHVTHSHRGQLPNLGRLNDVSDYLLDPAAAGFTSASESEADTDAEVEVLAAESRRVLSKDERQAQRDATRARTANANIDGNDDAAPRPARRERVEKRAIKLTELGPRMRLRLTKVEEGLCGGKIMWHEYINKSRGEEKEMEKVWEKRKREKDERRRVQKENVERKRKERGQDGKGGEGEEDEEDEEMEDLDDYDDDAWDDEEFENADVGAEDEEAEVEGDEMG